MHDHVNIRFLLKSMLLKMVSHDLFSQNLMYPMKSKIQKPVYIYINKRENIHSFIHALMGY